MRPSCLSDAHLALQGDNNMLLSGPGANFLVKELQSCLQSGKPSRPELAYLVTRPGPGDRFAPSSEGDRPLSSADSQLRIVGHRASRLVYALHDLRKAKDADEAGIAAHLDSRLAARASKAHAAYFVLYSFSATLDSLRRSGGASAGVVVDEKMLAALERVRSLYALEVCILADMGDYTEDGYMSEASMQEVERESARLMAEIRPDVLGLVEAADMRDWYLASPLGCSDGRAYERMMDFMKSEPINHIGEAGARDRNGVLKGFRDVLGTLTHGEVERWNEDEAAKREEERRVERLAKL